MNRNELRLEMMPLPPRVTVIIERQLNDVELRHDPERVRVASLTVCSSGRLAALSFCRLTVLLIILRLYRY